MNNYSVLMSVYIKEKADNLITSVDSIMQQTIRPSDFVIVCDGPLNDELYEALDNLASKYNVINIVKLPVNVGLGTALSKGLVHTKYETVMRMDSDDICLPHRAEKQLPLMEKYDLVGSWISEFEDDEKNVIGIRRVPKEYKKIKRFAKTRCPFNHPSVMFHKNAIERAGGYQKLLFVEDYFLWIRVLMMTDRVFNVQECLVNMRSGKAMRARRGGKVYRKSLKELRKYMLSKRFINHLEYFFVVIKQTLFLVLPINIKNIIYKLFLRRH